MNIVDLYDTWTFEPHPHHALLDVRLTDASDGRCLLDALTACRDRFSTLSVQLRYACEPTTAKTKPKWIDYPVMLGSELAVALDGALHEGRREIDHAALTAGSEPRPAACLTPLADLRGTFMINGILKYLPTHLYLRNRSIHTNAKGESIYYHYYTTDTHRNKSCMIVRGDRRTFFLNKQRVSEEVILAELLQSDKLALGSHFRSPCPEGFLDLMAWSTVPTDYDDLRHKLFFSAGHILYLLTEHTLNGIKGNANTEFQKKLASGNLKFLLSATAKFLANVARESEDGAGYDNVHNVFKELSLLNPFQSRHIAQQIVKATSGYSCADRKRRLIHDSEYGFICPLGSVDGQRVGLLLDFAQQCELSGPLTRVPWDEVVACVQATLRSIGLPTPTASQTTMYIFINDVPVEKIGTDHPRRDIHLLYLSLAPALRRLVPHLEFRHDGYLSLFVNIYAGLVVRDGITPAEFQDFLKTEKEFDSIESIYTRLLPFHHHNPATKNIFVLHSLKCMIQRRRPDIDFVNFNDYIYVTHPDQNEVGMDGFYMETIYMPYKELTAEDAIVIKESTSRRFTTVHADQIRLIAQTTVAPILRVREGDFVTIDTLLLELTDPHAKVKITRKCYTSATDARVSVWSHRSGTVTQVRSRFARDEAIVVVILTHERQLGVGAKLLTVHGQKSVVSAIVPDDQMPTSAVTGRSPDAIGSCESFVSRFTLGQIREGLAHGGHDTYLEGYRHPVFWGKTFYFLLNHFAEDKIFTYKDKLNLSRLSQQPLRGKAKFGGLKFGSTELASLTAFGLSEVVYNKFITESDGQTLYLCRRHGCLHGAEGIANVRGHHGTHAGTFGQHAFSVKRMCEDYAICGYDISIKRGKR